MRHLLSMRPLFLCYKQSVGLLLYLLVQSAVQDTKGVFEPGWRQRTPRLRVVLPGKQCPLRLRGSTGAPDGPKSHSPQSPRSD